MRALASFNLTFGCGITAISRSVVFAATISHFLGERFCLEALIAMLASQIVLY